MIPYSSDSTLIREFFDKMIDNIRVESLKQKRVASGRTIASLQGLVTTASGGQIQASANILKTEFGTSPEEAMGETYRSLVDSLIGWMGEKGLDLNPYAIAHSLRKHGSNLYKQGGNSGVLSKFITDDQLNAFTETMANKYLKETQSQLL